MRIMKSFKSLTKAAKALIITLMIGANVIGPVLLGPVAMAAETTYGVLNLSGNVPEIFQLDVRGVSGDIDLNGGSGAAATTVSNRLVGIFHLKVNIDIASFILSTTNASGTFENAAAAAYPFSAVFTLNVNAACTLLSNGTPITTALLLAGATNIRDALGLPSVLGFGVEEDCQVIAGWTNQNVILPLAGVYTLPVVATMVSV
ncbi:MAG: hypothetical protein AABZ55_07405 [Bdellovibrionota bacterium]